MFRIRISLNADPDPGFYPNADPDSGLGSRLRITITIINKLKENSNLLYLYTFHEKDKDIFWLSTGTVLTVYSILLFSYPLDPDLESAFGNHDKNSNIKKLGSCPARL